MLYEKLGTKRNNNGTKFAKLNYVYELPGADLAGKILKRKISCALCDFAQV